MSSRGTNNPTGVNQYPNCPPPDDPEAERIIRDYHRRGYTSRDKISTMLLSEHNLDMRPPTVARRLKLFGLSASGATTKNMPDEEKYQYVLDVLEDDTARNLGPRMVKEKLAHTTGVHLTRDYIKNTMKTVSPEGFSHRAPGSRKLQRVALVSLGPNHEWSMDGHDKLSKIGFDIYGSRDVFSGKWLLLETVPNNRLGLAVAYLYLDLIEKMGGMPIQTTTDCGSETTEIFGLAKALREAFSDIPTPDVAAFRYLKSVHNITIERGWHRLRLNWGENVPYHWELGRAIYNYDANDARQYKLCRWLWSKLIQKELDDLKDWMNDHPTKYDPKKKLPSGVSPHEAYVQYAAFGAEKNYLEPIPRETVRALKDQIGDEHIRFVEPEYAAYAHGVYEMIGQPKLTFQNVWVVFRQMMEVMYGAGNQ